MNTVNISSLPAPRVLPEVATYWEAASAGRLLVKRCSDCHEVHFYPRDICPHCLSERTEWLEASGLGTVYSFSTMKRPGPEGKPYTLAYVTLDEGVTMMTNLVEVDLSNVKIGSRVRVLFNPSQNRDGSAGPLVPVFTLA
jgi:uncharacterized protein